VSLLHGKLLVYSRILLKTYDVSSLLAQDRTLETDSEVTTKSPQGDLPTPPLASERPLLVSASLPPSFRPQSLRFIRVDGVPRITPLSGLHDGMLVSCAMHPFTYREVGLIMFN